MSQLYWQAGNPVGRWLQLGSPDARLPWITIVSVVGNVKHFGLDRESYPTIYLPFDQSPRGSMKIVVRSAGDPLALIAPLRRALREVDPLRPIYNVRTMKQLVAESLWQKRLFTLLFWIFGAIALILAAGGLYSVISYTVSQRAQELGIRTALGADRWELVRMVVRQGLLLAAAGLAFGLPLSLALSGAMRSLLFEISPMDLPTLAGVSLLLLLVALLASFIPARRATRVDPTAALRSR